MKKILCFLLVFAMAFGFAGCKKSESLPAPPLDQTPTVKPPQEKPTAPAPEEEAVAVMDFAALGDVVIDQVFPVNADLMLVSSHPKTDFPTPEQYELHLYRPGDKSFEKTQVKGFVDYGELKLSLDGGFAYGLLKNKDFFRERLFMLDTKTAAVTYLDLPKGDEVFFAAIAPDKSKIAYTTIQGVFLADGAFKNPVSILPRVKDSASTTGDTLPVADGFLDNNRLLYHVNGYEWVAGVGVYDTKTKENLYSADVSEVTVQPMADGRAFYSAAHTMLPAGFVTFENGEAKVSEVLPLALVPGADSKDSDLWSQVDGIRVSPSGNYGVFYGLINRKDGQRMAARVYDLRTGALRDSYDCALNHQLERFELADFVSDDQIVLKTVYVKDYGMRAMTWDLAK